MKIKAVLYPQIMFLETALKNYALEIIVDEANSDRFADIYSTLLNNHMAYAVGTDDYKRTIAKRRSVRNKIYLVTTATAISLHIIKIKTILFRFGQFLK